MKLTLLRVPPPHVRFKQVRCIRVAMIVALMNSLSRASGIAQKISHCTAAMVTDAEALAYVSSLFCLARKRAIPVE